MPSTELAKFLEVALKMQNAHHNGVRVVDNTLIAANGYQLIALEGNSSWVSGEGVIPSVSADVIRAYAERVFVRRLVVSGNVVEIEVQTTRCENGETVAGEWVTVTLPSFYVRPFRIETALSQTKPPQARLVAQNVSLRAVREAKVKDTLALVEMPMDGKELFRPARNDDPLQFKALQIRECLPIFGHRARLNTWTNEKGWLVLRDQFNVVFVVTPVVRRKE